jgi:hypothetical protein
MRLYLKGVIYGMVSSIIKSITIGCIIGRNEKSIMNERKEMRDSRLRKKNEKRSSSTEGKNKIFKESSKRNRRKKDREFSRITSFKEWSDFDEEENDNI